MTIKVLKASIETVRSLGEIALSLLGANDVLLLDVDDTLITPKDACFRHDNRENTYVYMFDNLKTKFKDGKVDKDIFEKILGNWRLSRKTMLVEQEWPQVFKDLKDRGVIILGLTNCHLGDFGPIKSMEKWRYDELKGHDLVFSNVMKSDQVETIVPGKVSYYKGIFFNQGFSKGEVLQQIIPYLSAMPGKLVFLDDRKTNAASVKETCSTIGVPCTSYEYRAVERIQQTVDYDWAKIQKETLFNDYVWLDDSMKKNHS